jgi:hypothetical protein
MSGAQTRQLAPPIDLRQQQPLDRCGHEEHRRDRHDFSASAARAVVFQSVGLSTASASVDCNRYKRTNERTDGLR